MADKKGIGSTVMGWFVVREDEPEPASTDELIAKYAEAPAAPPPVELSGSLPKSVDGTVDFPAVYAAAGLDAEGQSRIEKAMSLLKSLPAQTPAEVKKQIVEASLKAFGVPIDQIIESGVLEIQALEVYIRNGERDTQALINDGKKRIEELTAEIARCSVAMEGGATAQQKLAATCNAQKLLVQEVLEFFGADAVARVVHESSKLHEVK